MSRKRTKQLQEFLSVLSADSLDGIDFNDLNAAINSEGENALHAALWSEHYSEAIELIELGIELNVHGDMGDTPLHVAVRKDLLEITKLMVKNGADLFALNEWNNTPIMQTKADSQTVVEYLKTIIPRSGELRAFVSKLKTLKATGSTDADALRAAVIHQDLSLVKELIYLGTDRFQPDDVGRQLLHHAATLGNIEIVKFLIESTCFTNEPDQHNHTPLSLAKLQQHEDVVDLLTSTMRSIENDNLRRTQLAVGIRPGENESE